MIYGTCNLLQNLFIAQGLSFSVMEILHYSGKRLGIFLRLRNSGSFHSALCIHIFFCWVNGLDSMMSMIPSSSQFWLLYNFIVSPCFSPEIVPSIEPRNEGNTFALSTYFKWVKRGDNVLHFKIALYMCVYKLICIYVLLI